MKSSSSTRNSKKGRVRWDEENLSKNEVVKKEINATAIEEPKTPYHSPCASQTDLRGRPILSFPPTETPAIVDLEAELEEYQTRLDEELATEGLVDEDEMQRAASPHGSKRVSFDATANGHDPLERESSSEFAEYRKQHYSMKDALQKCAVESLVHFTRRCFRGKALIEEETTEEA